MLYSNCKYICVFHKNTTKKGRKNMRKFAKLLIPALLVVAMMVACSVMFASAAEKTIYISATGTGDGSSATSPLGPGTVTATTTGQVLNFTNTPYADAVQQAQDKAVSSGKVNFQNDELSKANVVYKAFEALGEDGGTIVVVGAVAFDAGANFEKGYNGEFLLPEAGPITIKGNDANAKLVLDHAKVNSTSVGFNSDVTIKDIAMEYNYNSSLGANYNKEFCFFAMGNDLTIDTGVTIKSFDYATGTAVAGDWIPSLFAGCRAVGNEKEPVLTVKSGKFDLFAAGRSTNGTNNGKIKNSKIVVYGGDINTINGGGIDAPANRAHGVVKGDVTIEIYGGKVGKINCVTGGGIEGKLEIKIDAAATAATVGEIEYTDQTGNPAAALPTSKKLTYVTGTIEAAKITGFAAAEITVNAQPTTPPQQQQQPQNPPQTGSALTLIAVVAVVALAGSAVVISKKSSRI